MGGKSTLLRSTCVAVIMAQLGCYVPASRAVLEPVDAIFTRIGEHTVSCFAWESCWPIDCCHIGCLPARGDDRRAGFTLD